MNGLTRWNQLQELDAVRPGSSNLSHHSPIHLPEGQEEQMTMPEYATLVDIREDDKGYVIKTELPGVKQEDVQVTITIDEVALTITGERKFDQNSKSDQLVEHAKGRFAHVFSLPPDAWPPEVSAVFRNEVLIMHLAKNHESGPKQVVAEAPAREPIAVRESHSSGWGINE